MKTLLWAVATIVVFVLIPAAVTAQSRNSGTTHVRKIFVRVTNAEGVPVTGLSAADFTATEEGQVRAVSHVGPADEPMRIALMLDTSDGTAPALNHMRAATVAFFDALAPQDEVVLITTGRQVRVRLPATTDRQKLKDMAAGLFSDGGGTVLMDGLLEIDDRFFKKAEDRWPVFVIFTSDGNETSSGGRENEFMKWALAIGPRGVTAHALVLKTPKGRGLPETTLGMPQIVAENLTQNTGGDYEIMNSTAVLADKMTAVARSLRRAHRNMNGWYAVDIQTSTTGARPVEVVVARPGVLLQVSDRRRGQ